MEERLEWEPYAAFLLFVPERDRRGVPVPDYEFKLDDLRRAMNAQLPNTEIMIRGKGSTPAWGREDTLMFLVLADLYEAARVSVVLRKLADDVCRIFDQDEVWTTRQDIELLRTFRPTGSAEPAGQ